MRKEIDMIVAEKLMRHTKAQLVDMLMSNADNQVIFPSDLVEVLGDRLDPFRFAKQEHFLVATLNGAHRVIHLHEISKGLVNHTLVHPREVYRKALEDNAVAVILAHNHPSGILKPSRDDLHVNERLKKAGELMGITVLDHIIFGPNLGFYSFLESGEF
jgi:DNA repair protein RadC